MKLLSKQKKQRNKGFSLIEMIVVSSLMLMLMTVVMIGYRASAVRSRDKQREKDISQVQVALEQYYEVHGNYPVASSMNTLLSNAQFTEFLQNNKVQDPINTGSFQYTISSDGESYQLSYTRERDQVQVIVNTVGS